MCSRHSGEKSLSESISCQPYVTEDHSNLNPGILTSVLYPVEASGNGVHNSQQWGKCTKKVYKRSRLWLRILRKCQQGIIDPVKVIVSQHLNPKK